MYGPTVGRAARIERVSTYPKHGGEGGAAGKSLSSFQTDRYLFFYCYHRHSTGESSRSASVQSLVSESKEDPPCI